MRQNNLKRIFYGDKPEMNSDKNFMSDIEDAQEREFRIRKLQYKHGTKQLSDVKSETRY